MCTGIEIMAIGGIAMNAGSQMYGGLKEKEAGYKQQALNEVDARSILASAQNTVKQIRRQKQAVQSAARAAYAGSGIDVNSGVADLIDNDINVRASEDMYQVLVEGGQQADRVRAVGKAAAKAGEDADTASTINAGATVLNGYGRMSGWK